MEVNKQINEVAINQSEQTERLMNKNRDGLIIQAKHNNFYSSIDGDYHKYIDQSVEYTKPNDEITSINLENAQVTNMEMSVGASRLSKTSLSDGDLSDAEKISFKNKYKHSQPLISDDSELSSSSPLQNEKLQSMKVTFNKHKANKYLSQDRARRKQRKGELEFVSTKVDSANHTLARNSQRINTTLNAGDLPKNKSKPKYYTHTVSTNVSHRRKSRRRSTNNSNKKSRNKCKSNKSKRRMMVETTKASILSKLMPKQQIWSKMNVTPLASD